MIIYLVIGFVVGVVFAKYWLGRWTRKDEAVSKSLNQEQTLRKRRHLAEIVTEVNARGEITNDEIEKKLGVSDATAERYLEELEQQGKIVQIGRTGKTVKYAGK